MPEGLDASLATHGGWRFTRDGVRATYATPAVVVEVATAAPRRVHATVRVLGRSLALDDPLLSLEQLRALLRWLGTSRVCVGVGAADSGDARWAAGFDALAERAVRDGAAELLRREPDSLVIGTRAGGELLNHVDRVVAGAPVGPRFRALACLLVISRCLLTPP